MFGDGEISLNPSLKALKAIELAYWQRYVDAYLGKEDLRDVFVSAGYAGNPQITDELLALYLSGKKTAGSSLVEDFLSAGDPLPQVGNHWIYLNGKGEPSCILKTEKIIMNKFKDVPVAIAMAEGEGDLSIEYWKRVHTELYTPFLNTWRIADLNNATVITEFFRIVYNEGGNLCV